MIRRWPAPLALETPDAHGRSGWARVFARLGAEARDPLEELLERTGKVIDKLEDDDLSVEPGIADVRSGADGTALDGSSYSEW